VERRIAVEAAGGLQELVRGAAAAAAVTPLLTPSRRRFRHHLLWLLEDKAVAVRRGGPARSLG
jgi:hypothetical protein